MMYSDGVLVLVRYVIVTFSKTVSFFLRGGWNWILDIGY